MAGRLAGKVALIIGVAGGQGRIDSGGAHGQGVEGKP